MAVTRRTMFAGVTLVVLVTVAAGIGGTAHFTRARWLPHHFRPKPTTGGVYIPGPAQRPSGQGGSSGLPVWLVVIAVVIVAGALALLAVFAWRWWRNRGLAPAGEPAAFSLDETREGMSFAEAAEAEIKPEPERLLTGAELALAELDQGLEPGDAVVRAWLGLQETAEESGIPRRKAETPTEFTSRVLRVALLDDRAVRTLLRLYLRTRFGEHPVTPDDVVEVSGALKQLVASWETADGASRIRTR
jgi:hypothetical protein